jgi:hypothetical protein
VCIETLNRILTEMSAGVRLADHHPTHAHTAATHQTMSRLTMITTSPKRFTRSTTRKPGHLCSEYCGVLGACVIPSVMLAHVNQKVE